MGLKQVPEERDHSIFEFPSHFTADDIVKRNKNSIMIPGQQSLMKANSQSINPTTIGWLLWSNPTKVDFLDLEKVLHVLWMVWGGLGLYWALVWDGTKYDPSTTARVLHKETEEELGPWLISLAEKTYGGRFSNKIEDYPLGISMMFVHPFNDVPAKACGMVKQFATYQKMNEMMLTSSSWLGEISLDWSIKLDRFEPFLKMANVPHKYGGKEKERWHHVQWQIVYKHPQGPE